ncbi:HET-domain-containing protein [Daldinia vernicosa]|uniref:HET-domain-containing protein n=1 Tax=Daldinia vernicosa TaxID=114800 RepID=UPI002008688D|nr:HET-domain-containing protein [Daldinia vernicosa]KAI0849025.1 HET-domain-containing protein [Daldinia vernicosa]
MRLIDVNTLELKEFFSEKAPPYAILSHTWKGGTEVTFQEWERAATDSTVKRKEGYIKIVEACRRAQADGLQYLWCDTNCIDKSSSAELSEAINSMFAWYRDSSVCYAYLHDAQAETDTFAESRWFTRGWTLQELLAPSKVLFFDHGWTMLGDKSGLAEVISSITRIHIDALRDRSTMHSYSIAQRMSWAADRQTTRPEDIAYCLLGIFDINMPLLYGEGSKAFTRLQREIIKVSDDQSILVWDLRDPDASSLTSALASSPNEFQLCDSVAGCVEIGHLPYSITNLGISMNLPVIETLVGGVVLAGLNCAKELHRKAVHSKMPDGIKISRQFQIWIPLYRSRNNIYFRVHCPYSKLFLSNSYSILRPIIPTNLFLSLDVSQAPIIQHLERVPSVLQPASLSHSGSLVMVAGGETIPRSCSLKKAYPLGDISIAQLKPKGTSTVSHQLISSGDLSVLFSVFWDMHRLPQKWLHSTMFQPRLRPTNQITSQDFARLFGEDEYEKSIQNCSSIAEMQSLHTRLQQMYKTPLSTYVEEKKDPFINVDDQHLRDSFGDIELIVEVIFRDIPKSMGSRPPQL